MRKFFVKNEQVIEDRISIEGQDAFHIFKVLRLKKSEKLMVCDECFIYEAIIEKANLGKCILKIIKKTKKPLGENSVKITLFQSLCKYNKMDLIIQKTVELGVFEIVPIITERVVLKLHENVENKINRWQKIANEAAKQCLRDDLVKIKNPINLNFVFEQIKNFQSVIMPYEELGKSGINNLKETLNKNLNSTKIAIIIGPEGGFTKKEATLISEKGVTLVGLGKRILRTETTAITLVSIIMYEKNQY